MPAKAKAPPPWAAIKCLPGAKGGGEAAAFTP